MTTHSEILVVGGGIFGAAGALELAGRGYGVLLVDRGPLPHPAASSTDISKAIRPDYGSDVFYTGLMERALDGWRAWNKSWERPLYHETGFLWLSHREMEAGSFEGDSYRVMEKRGHRPQRITPRKLAARFPAWAEGGYVDGYFSPQAGWTEAGQVVVSLLEACRKQGVILDEEQPVTGLLEEDGRVTGIRTAGGSPLQAEWVVLAAGAWIPELFPELADKVWPVGQPVIHFEVADVDRFQPPRFVPWGSDIARTGWYGFPALDDGTLKIANHGPGKRMAPTEKAEINPGQEEAFQDFLARNLPAAASAPLVDARLCFYADSWDGDFYIDRVPGRPGLVIATGGSGHAFKFAPLLGTWIADALEGRDNPDLQRFAWREKGERRTEKARHT